ncbi:transposase [Roseateles sp.]|uniref:transposase n=1 Tax=Roseateles sp. TaxID=1971397 RepID=UPI0039ED8C7D
MPRAQIEASLAPLFAYKDRAGRLVEDADLFGPTRSVAGAGMSKRDCQRLPIRLMLAPLYLMHAYGERDESMVERWAQGVSFQFFSGQVYFEPQLPCDATKIGRFRHMTGEAGVEQLIKTTIKAAMDMMAISQRSSSA